MFVLKRFFARVIPDIPKTLELKMKREDHIASTILAETQPNKKAKKTHAKKHNWVHIALYDNTVSHTIFIIRNVGFCDTCSTGVTACLLETI